MRKFWLQSKDNEVWNDEGWSRYIDKIIKYKENCNFQEGCETRIVVRLSTAMTLIDYMMDVDVMEKESDLITYLKKKYYSYNDFIDSIPWRELNVK